MENLQEQVNDVCRLADAVIKNPSADFETTARNIGVCAAVAGFAAGGGMVFAPLLLGGPVGLAVAAATWIAKKLNKEKEQQEKERMLREVIRKQQAVIRRLEAELVKSRQQNAQNRQEIENLKKMLRMLEETIDHLEAA